MKRNWKVILTAIVLTLLPSLVHGQVKMYTKKARMVDFLTKTTKVVISGDSPMEAALRSEVVSCWRASSYEFCGVEDYEKFKTSAEFYFLRMVNEDGITFLSLSKGGVDEGDDNFSKPFEVARIPVAPEGQMSGREMIFFGAYIDILQNFAEKAMSSDRIAYGGISSFAGGVMKNKFIMLDEEAADEAFVRGESGALIPVFVQSSTGKTCYKMLIEADSHELVHFSKSSVKKGHKASFSDAELKSFEKKDATPVR